MTDQIDQLLSLAEQLKAAGNAKLKDNDRKQAIDLYSQGVEAIRAVIGVSSASPTNLLSVLLSNRAHVHLLMGENASALSDCKAAFQADPGNVKAYWRAGKAAAALSLPKDALVFAEQAAAKDPANSELQQFVNQCKAAVINISPEEIEHRQTVMREVAEQAAVAAAQIQGFEIEAKKHERTIQALNEVREGRKSLIPCGKAFIVKDRRDVLQNLTHQIKGLKEEKIPELEKARRTIEGRKAEAEKRWNECLEFLRQRKK